MRFLEFKKGITVAITNEEQDVLELLRGKGVVNKTKLSEREQTIANQLVNKNIIVRKKSNEQITYKLQPSQTSF
jgi:hypothetical protein|tara:strand:- start:67 stop:288 length:222 start_codon:yes stop_codon:yes gene_type:complete